MAGWPSTMPLPGEGRTGKKLLLRPIDRPCARLHVLCVRKRVMDLTS